MEKVQELSFFNALLPLVIGVFIIALGVILLNQHFHKNLYKQKLRQEELKNQHQIDLLETSLQVQEEERKRIAADLHDRLGSMLSTVKLIYGSLDESLERKNPEAQLNFEKANRLMDEAVLEVRRIAHGLSTGIVITHGLLPALEDLCESISKSKRLECRLLNYGADILLEQKMEIGIYRMIQEIVSNVLKHAEASQLILQVNKIPGWVNITIEDNGKGFDVQEMKNKAGMGLKNLETRAANMKIRYHIDSTPGRGTISIIEIPLKSHD